MFSREIEEKYLEDMVYALEDAGIEYNLQRYWDSGIFEVDEEWHLDLIENEYNKLVRGI